MKEKLEDVSNKDTAEANANLLTNNVLEFQKVLVLLEKENKKKEEFVKFNLKSMGDSMVEIMSEKQCAIDVIKKKYQLTAINLKEHTIVIFSTIQAKQKSNLNYQYFLSVFFIFA